MEKPKYKRMKGSQSFRERMLLATLSSTPIIIDEIRADDMIAGLRLHERSLLGLLDTIFDDSHIKTNLTGTQVIYEPGIVMGRKNLVHNCALTRSIGYYLEPLLLLGLFGKEPLSIRLKGITNDPKDLSVDTIRSTTLNILKRFGVAPDGGGQVLLTVPNVQTLTAVQWLEEGMVKKIRGVTFSARVSTDFEHSMRFTARGIFNNLLPDVHISQDHKAGPLAGKSPGYGISLVAETTSGCYISADTTVSCGRRDETGELDVEKQERKPPQDTGVDVASWLLQEIEKGGVVDSTHQVRVGTLSPYGVETLRNLKEFLGVTFEIKPDPLTGTVILTCLGSGLINLARKLS
ncbi:hypothetical protein EUTSA_v10029476mg [Eutrema salsugineum]|uniref:RNA 3'-terminal phosphate cyclase domain-containing protein n=1 Tax=Eutrema salsugineum TaxID=72664 RepID=V4L6L2_EUTSA|nr:hypothetical protein EUTSA_v10029476mg [Eutrema salsugineum]